MLRHCQSSIGRARPVLFEFEEAPHGLRLSIGIFTTSPLSSSTGVIRGYFELRVSPARPNYLNTFVLIEAISAIIGRPNSLRYCNWNVRLA